MSRTRLIVILGLITLLGAFLRFNAISIYKFYADSYLPLILSLNIQNYHSVIGTLGPNGMIYPDFFSWTRPLYPLLINLFDLFTNNLELAARAVSFLSGVFSIPLCYLFIENALRSKKAGLFGALLLALSYNHDIWGGFILSDTTGVMMLFLFLWLLFRTISSKEESDAKDGIMGKSDKWADPQDLIIGAVFALTVLTRYEYAILAIPTIFLLYFKSSHRKELFINITAGVSLVFALAYSLLSPFTVNGNSENPLQSFTSLERIKTIDISAIKGFMLSDPLISLLFVIGIFLMIRKYKEKKYLLIFTVLSLIIFEFMYYQINSGMQRYTIHLLPFLLIPASYVLTEINKINKFFVRYLLTTLFIFGCVWQGYFTYTGLHDKNNGIWFIQSYEDMASKLVLPYIRPDDTLIASFPEAYYLGSKVSTHSISDTAPFVYIPENENIKNILIIEDMGLRTIFPNFSSLVHLNLVKFKVLELPISVPSAIFRHGNNINNSDGPIVLYRLPLSELKNLIK